MGSACSLRVGRLTLSSSRFSATDSAALSSELNRDNQASQEVASGACLATMASCNYTRTYAMSRRSQEAGCSRQWTWGRVRHNLSSEALQTTHAATPQLHCPFSQVHLRGCFQNVKQ
jgi:hypothetical protein